MANTKPTQSTPRAGLGALALLGALTACAGNDPDAQSANLPAPSVTLPGGGVDNYNRPPGMPIGRGTPSGGEEPFAREPSGGGIEPSPSDVDDLEIPDFEPPEDTPPPCSGCVELSADVNDINQRDSFVFSADGAAVTSVVWTILVPFNSDQLFVQPFVNNSYGTYTDLDANAFPIGTPVELVHAYTGNASTVGLAIGSAGAWTGNMTMSVFVDSVTFEGPGASESRTFDTGVEGLVPGSNARNPRIVFHP